jgi:predicted protein tyrosine phosphatase
MNTTQTPKDARMDHTTPRKILAICSANRCRSVTLAALVNATPECEARSAGTHPIPGGNPITETDLRWAHLIIVFEEVHVRTLKSRFPNVFSRLQIINLEIPDLYPPYNQALIDLLRETIPQRLGFSLTVSQEIAALATREAEDGTEH